VWNSRIHEFWQTSARREMPRHKKGKQETKAITEQQDEQQDNTAVALLTHTPVEASAIGQAKNRCLNGKQEAPTNDERSAETIQRGMEHVGEDFCQDTSASEVVPVASLTATESCSEGVDGGEPSEHAPVSPIAIIQSYASAAGEENEVPEDVDVGDTCASKEGLVGSVTTTEARISEAGDEVPRSHRKSKTLKESTQTILPENSIVPNTPHPSLIAKIECPSDLATPLPQRLFCPPPVAQLRTKIGTDEEGSAEVWGEAEKEQGKGRGMHNACVNRGRDDAVWVGIEEVELAAPKMEKTQTQDEGDTQVYI